VTVPLAGDYDVAWGGRIALIVAGVVEGFMLMNVGGAQLPVAAAMLPTAQYGGGQSAADYRATGVTAGTLMRAKYSTQGSLTFQFSNRWLKVHPVRVG
jgi:hypothetical protein